MTKQKTSISAPHALPTDFRTAINADAVVKNVWADITPLACLPAGRRVMSGPVCRQAGLLGNLG
ncbi:MAG: hypothetical protein Q8Q23_05900 [bacterium]|nr:hypothetical protein [bacterium]